MSRAEEFERLRSPLLAIAYRILGSVAETDDAVQETWLRFESSATVPRSTKAFLSAVVTRISIDVLRSARARRHMDAGRPRFAADRREREELAARFFDALREGDVDGLTELLAADVQLVGDSGGKAPRLAPGALRSGDVAGLLCGFFARLSRVEVTLVPREINGQPGAIVRDRDGRVLNTLTVEVARGRIQSIRSVINPDKLGHLGTVADAWEVTREARELDQRG